MRKIKLIISREYLSRIRKKSFIIMTFLGPLIFAAFLVLPVLFSTMEDKEEKIIAVIDSSNLFAGVLPESEYIRFQYLNNVDIESFKSSFKNTEYYALLFISQNVTYSPNSVVLYSDKQPNMSLILYIKGAIEREVERLKLKANGLDEEIMASIKTNIKLNTITWTDTGEEKHRNTGVVMAVGYIAGFMIYFFIFLFGAQVMRGVLEEKTNRIVEVIISSVKPFQLMMGKIIGIGLVALTQFVLWVTLTLSLVIVIQSVFKPELKTPSSETVIAQDVLSAEPANKGESFEGLSTVNDNMIAESFKYLKEIDFGVLLFSFFLFFIGGYILYASLFAIVGAASDQDTDTQQFMMPITIPLVFAIFVMINAINNPNSALALWCSFIPLTSPIVMMVRIPFGVPYWQVWLSITILAGTFIGTTWMAGKIYRTGILMYGKKITYKELWKWLRYKN